jgi:hypothetical protein
VATDQLIDLGYPTLQSIVNNYSSADSRALYIWAARILDRMCPFLRVLPMIESNNILSNIATRTDYIPFPVTRRFNEGVNATASKNTPISDPISLLEAYSEVDYAEYKIQNDPDAWRMDQDANQLEGFRQKAESLFFYGNTSFDPGAFNGLATRFNNLESYPNGLTDWLPNCQSTGLTSGNSTSAWIVEFGKNKVTGIYPKNTPGGLMIENLGRVTKEYSSVAVGNPTNKLYEVMRTHFMWYLGLQVIDERCVYRICNINPTILASSNFDENIFIQALNYLPDAGENPSTAIFVNRALKTQIDIRATSQKINAYTNFTQDSASMDVFGRPVTRFRGVPIMVAEKITSTETVLT